MTINVAAVAMAVFTVVSVFPGLDSQTVQCWSTPVPPYMLTFPCYHNKCRCNNYTLDCSSNFGKLLYVPRVFDNVQVLNFSNNALRRILDDGFLANVSEHVWLIDLYNNGLTHITADAFKNLRKLTTLLIGGNNLNYAALDPVFGVATLRSLDIKCGSLGSIPTGVFSKAAMTRLEHLDLSWNNLGLNGTLDMREFQPLTRLKSLNLWDNNIYSLKTAFLPSLELLAFHKNRLFDFPQTCNMTTRHSLFPRLVELRLESNAISIIQDPVCLPKLRALYLQYNQIVNFSTNMFSGQRFPVLQNVELNEMHAATREIAAYAFNNSALRSIHLDYSRLDFSGPKVHEAAFHGCFALEDIRLGFGQFQHVSDDRFHRLLGRLNSLQTLYLEFTAIEHISVNTFAVFPNMERLYLFGNLLTEISDGAFDRLSNLKTLSLSQNSVSAISKQVFSPETRERLQQLDLSGNPFQCGCGIVWLQQWLKDSPSKFQDYANQGYRCANLDNTTVQDFYISEQACIMSNMAAVMTIIFTSLVILMLAASFLCFGYRWQWRLWLYEVCRARDRRWPASWPARHFTYDVFVAYAEEDVDWVLGELLPMLEGHWGLRLCIHQRDFIPGKHILDNISDCVDESDKIMMVFTPHFARSEWCQFELKMCQTCVMDRDDVLLLVTLQETVPRTLTGAMLAVMRTTTYIEWDESSSARASFWGRLRIALDDVIDKRGHFT